ncbi:MAG: phosphatase PAP2 family protein [Reyranella sp.]|nr:phosphatase PAP2 family protein [Reyranella sp.]
MMLRRALLAFALLAALPAAAREPPYLTPQELDLVAILPPPDASPEQLALVLAAQRAATPERIEQAKRDVDESPDTMFGAVLGKTIDEKQLPATSRLFTRMRATEDEITGPAKKAFKRVRPYLSSSEVKPLVRPSTSGSYPSGHSTNATLAAIVMGNIVPEKRDAIWARAIDYSQSRIVGGMHYPNDLFGGKLAGTAIAVALQSRPEFKADFEAAKRELRQYLQLPL